MTIVFDTSALSALLSNDDHVVKTLSQQSYDQLLIPLAADAEVRFGFAFGNRPKENLERYELFKQQFNLEIMVPSQDTAIMYADLARWARQNGVALSNNDFWIAASCVQAGGSLMTLDQDFKHLPQVRLVDL